LFFVFLYSGFVGMEGLDYVRSFSLQRLEQLVEEYLLVIVTLHAGDQVLAIAQETKCNTVRVGWLVRNKMKMLGATEM
jgi:hypothetical protein